MKKIFTSLVLMALICVNGLLNAQIPTDGLVGYWPFNGNANDESGYGNHGTVMGATLTTDRFGNANSSYLFDSNTEYIDSGFDEVLGDNSRTICIWVKRSSTSAGNSLKNIFSIGYTAGSYSKYFTGLLHDAYGGVAIDIGGARIVYQSNMDTFWHFYTWVFDNSLGTSISKVKIYKDCILQTGILESIGPNNIINTIGGLRIANDLSGNSYFPGKIDDLRIYNRALTIGEIQQIYLESNATNIQAHNISIANVSTDHFTINWTDGNGTQRAAFIKQGTDGSATPLNNISYNPNTVFSLGSQIGASGWYCVFNGTEHPNGVTITGIQANTDYRVMVCEYNGTPGAEQYNTDAAINNPLNVHTLEEECNIVLSLPDTLLVCHQENAVLDAGGGFVSYLWNTGETSQTITVNETGNYRVTVEDNSGCSASDSTYVSIINAQITQNDTTVFAGQSLELSLTGAANIPTDGLVGYWPFNGNANDESGNGNNGTVLGATLTNDRYSTENSAYNFDGSNHHIRVLNASILNFGDTTDFTVNLWVNPNQIATGIKGLVSKSRLDGTPCVNGWQLTTNSNNKLYSEFGCGSTTAIYTGNQVLLTNTWYMVTFTVNRRTSTVGYYINTTSDGSYYSSFYQFNISNDYPLYFGIDRTLKSMYYFKGKLDDIRIFNRVLSQSEITMLFNEGTSSSAYSYLWSTGATTPSITVTPTQTTTYYCTISNGIHSCTDSITVTVLPQPEAICPGNLEMAANDPPVLLTGGIPSGGVYSGNGVNNGYFYPDSAGAGLHLVTYTWVGVNNYSDFCTFTINVTEPVYECNYIPNSQSWLGSSNISNASMIADNNLNTFGYLSMSYYSTTYTKSALITFPIDKNINSFKFKYSFPATVQSPCHGYPGPIYHTCKVKLYYKQGTNWLEAYPVIANLNTSAPPSVCEVVDSARFDFNTTSAKEWKVEMIGNYWLGAEYQTTTSFKLFEIGFKECPDCTLNPALNLPDTLVSCNNEEVTLDAGTDYADYYWSTGENTQTITVSTSGNYQVYVTDNSGCSAYGSTYVSLIKKHILQNDSTINSGQSIQLAVNSSNVPLSVPGFGNINVWSGHSYFVSNNALTWSQAKNICQSNGGHLVTISDFQENEIIKSLHPGSNLWIGLTDEILEGTFKWVTNEPFVYSHWSPGEPNNTVNEDYTEMYSSGYWNDAQTSNTRRFVLEFDDEYDYYTYLWSTGATTPSITVTPTQTTTYYCTISNGIHSCVDSVKVTVMAPFEVTCPGDIEVCSNQSLIALIGGEPTGGVYNGPGVFFGEYFDPATAGLGNHTITYSLTEAGYTDQCSFLVSVAEPPDVTCPADFAVCLNAGIIELNQAAPVGGWYEGNGVFFDLFNPLDAGLGDHLITYYYTASEWCQNSCTFTLSVVESPEMNCPAGFSVCISEPEFTLGGAEPAGGLYTINGNAGNVFNPETLGAGSHLVEYLYEIEGCSGMCSYTIEVIPLPLVDLGQDHSLLCNDFENNTPLPYQLMYNVPQYNSLQWTTSGTGWLSNPGIPNPVYHFSEEDIQTGQVTFTLTVEPEGICSVTVSDELTVFLPSQLIDIPAGWSGISSFIIPDDPNIVQLTAPCLENIIVQISIGGLYWPEQNVNTLYSWNANTGYKVKYEQTCCLPFAGTPVNLPSTVHLNVGTNYFPVHSQVPIKLTDLFGADTSKIITMVDIHTLQIYSPGFGVLNSLEYLEPGVGYLTYMSQSRNITYPVPDKNMSANITLKKREPYKVANHTSWNDVINTGSFHLISVEKSALSIFEPGDYLGAFIRNGNCVGMVEFKNIERLILPVFGDDPYTSEQQGFKENEYLSFKLYRNSSGEESDLNVVFDPSMPNHDGLFASYGLSSIIALNTGAMSVGDIYSDKVTISPNPAFELLTVVSSYGLKSIKLQNMISQTIYTAITDGSLHHEIDVSKYPEGVYFISVESENGSITTLRVVIQ